MKQSLMNYMHDDLEPHTFPINPNDNFYGLIGTLYFTLKPWPKGGHKMWDIMDKPKPKKTTQIFSYIYNKK